MEEERYELTPKGIFFSSLMRTHLITDLDDWQAELAWELFSNEMEKRGYVAESN